MNNIKYIFGLCSLAATFAVQGQVISFEESDALQKWSCTNGTIALSTSKVKVGESSLCWKAQAGSILTAANLADLRTASTKSKGGANLWIYNTKAMNEALQVGFYTDAGDRKCKLDVNLNFVGWRCIWVCFAEDLKHDRSQLSTMKLLMPASASGTVYLDYIEFVATSSWQRMPDYQSRIISGDATYLTSREVPAPVPGVVTPEQEAAVGLINKRLEEWYLGTGKHASDDLFKKRKVAVNSWMSTGKRNVPVIQANGTVGGSGLFSLGFEGKTIDGTSLKTFRNINEACLLQLAFDYRLNKTKASMEKASEIYDWYHDQGWADGSALGTLYLEMLRSGGFYHSVYLLRESLPEEQLKRIAAAQHWYTRLGDAYAVPETPGELADYVRALAIPKLHAILMLNDKSNQVASLQAYVRYLNNAFAYAPGFAGSFKPDGSGYHHRGSYMSAYYPQVVYVASLLYYLLHDTPFQLGEEVYTILKDALLSYRFLCGEYAVPGGLCGRFPGGSEVLHTLLPAYAYLLQSAETIDTELQRAFLRLWNPGHASVNAYLGKTATDICYTRSLGEVELLLAAAQRGGEAEAEPVGSKYMPYSGLLAVRQPEFMFTIKGFSKYIWDYESSSSENVYGRYLSNGHVEYSDLENRASTLQPETWDWLHLPGTTAKQITLEELHFKTAGDKHRNFSDRTFLGGIAFDKDVSLFTTRLHDNAIDRTFYADKSFFVFGNAVYCLGSGIKLGSATNEVHTTLFQNPKTMPGNVPVQNTDDATVCDNWGNYYLLHAGKPTLSENDRFALGYINHGKAPANAGYAYTWLIKPTEAQLKEHQAFSPFEVLIQGEGGHVLWNRQKGILMASVFRSGEVVGGKRLCSVSKPMMLVLKEAVDGALDIAFSNPDLDRESAANNNALTDAMVNMKGRVSELSFSIAGEYRNAEASSPFRVTAKDGITTVVCPESHDGETYRVRLAKDATGLPSVSEETITIRKERNACRINASGLPFKVYVSDVDGRMLQTIVSPGESILFPLTDLPEGMLLFRVSTSEKTVNRKVVNETHYIN